MNLQPRSTAEDNAARTDGTWESIYFQSLRADGDVLLVFSPTLGSTKGIASTPELNALLVKQSQTVDVDARNGVLKEIQELIADQALAIPLHASSLIYRDDSRGSRPAHPSRSLLGGLRGCVEELAHTS